jgi:hypothetical protein
MDPYLELYGWGDLHTSLIVEFKRQLNPQLTPKYLAISEERVYLEHFDDDRQRLVPDVLVTESAPKSSRPSSGEVMTATIEPEVHTVPMPIEITEPFLVIHDSAGNEIITVIEILSPTNKRPGTDGSREYHLKREEVLRSAANLVEVDLLRGGERPPLSPPLRTSSDFAVSIHRERRRPRADVYQWSMRHVLPSIPVPLAGGDPDVMLDLQKAFSDIWEYSAYSLRVQYDKPLKPPARPEDEVWIKEIISKTK